MTLEMEEMFDLKIAWPEYQFVYCRLRERLGIDDMYKRMRARLDQLSLHANVISQHKEIIRAEEGEERKIEQLQWLAATLAIGIILVGVWPGLCSFSESPITRRAGHGCPWDRSE